MQIESGRQHFVLSNEVSAIETSVKGGSTVVLLAKLYTAESSLRFIDAFTIISYYYSLHPATVLDIGITLTLQ